MAKILGYESPLKFINAKILKQKVEKITEKTEYEQELKKRLPEWLFLLNDWLEEDIQKEVIEVNSEIR